MYLIDLEFDVVRKILSLPPWHGARWSAWLRVAARRAGYDLESIVAAIMPFRHGQAPILAPGALSLRLLLHPEGLFLLPGLLAALAQTGGSGEFSSDSLRFRRAIDAASGHVIWAEGRPTGAVVAEFSEGQVMPEILELVTLPVWTLRFQAPLRLTSGPGQPGKFMQPEALATRAGLAHLLSRVRFVEKTQPGEPGVEPVAISLARDEMRYNAERQVALGGIAGEVVWRGTPDLNQARLLALGQYFGAGKNGRFGLGFWRIPELDCVRRVRIWG